MNTSLFRSKHAPVVAVLIAAFVALSRAWDAPFGRVPGAHRTFLLATGWAAVATLVIVMAYVLRKYAHRGRYSPEFAMRVDFAKLEGAENRIRRLRQRINAGALDSAKLIMSEANAILRDEGVHRVNRIVVEPGPPGGDPWTVRMAPAEPLGRVARWMHVHAFYGVAFGTLLFMHAGTGPLSGFGLVLAGLGYLVFVTGLIGIVLWSLGPRWLTRREKDLSIEEASALRASLRRKRVAALNEIDASVRTRLKALVGKPASDHARVRTTLRELTAVHTDRRGDIQDLAALIVQEQAVADELSALRRLRASFMAWRMVHIPAAILLTGLVAVHLLTIWRF